MSHENLSTSAAGSAASSAMSQSSKPEPTTAKLPDTSQTPDEQQKRDKKADRLATVVYLLQALHLLFGITAVIGMIINHTNTKAVLGTVAASHFKFQIITFWAGSIAYAVGFYLWITAGLWQAVAVILLVIVIRIMRGWWQLVAHSDVGNFW